MHAQLLSMQQQQAWASGLGVFAIHGDLPCIVQSQSNRAELGDLQAGCGTRIQTYSIQNNLPLLGARMGRSPPTISLGAGHRLGLTCLHDPADLTQADPPLPATGVWAEGTALCSVHDGPVLCAAPPWQAGKSVAPLSQLKKQIWRV
ncbi:hypothetical protein KIL84_005331 [Mauremys mutica]|uniref:Uncharacterized protein n=1 Tax=Mauremys mutica TaxID=74926 RepID=A0A9D4B600_9SAUR|nr:hypothetical protein KIL84_005331 [Mauremys mutica]